MTKWLRAILVVSMVLMVFSLAPVTTAEAALVQVFDRAALSDGTAFWGPSYIPGNPVTAAGITCTPSGLELNVRSDWGVNFSPGDYVLNTYDDLYQTAPDIRIDFAPGVYGAGTQMQTGAPGLFTGKIEAFGTGGSLGAVNVSGNSAQGNAGSAIFLGFLSSEPIDYVVFSWVSGDPYPSGLAINQLSIATSPVPIPPGIVLLAPPLLGLLAFRLRRR